MNQDPILDQMTAISRAERRRAQTRERITAAARELLLEQGAAGLRLTEVAERADVAFGSLYTYFENKEAIVDAVLATTLSAMIAADRPGAERYDDPAEEIAAASRRVVRTFCEQRELAVALMSLEHAQERFVEILAPRSQELLERGAAAGRFTLTDPAAVTAYLLAGGFELIRGVLDGRFGDDADVICADTALRTVGIPPDEAAAIAHRPL
jgi:AcrR family transcriptional regulator